MDGQLLMGKSQSAMPVTGWDSVLCSYSPGPCKPRILLRWPVSRVRH